MGTLQTDGVVRPTALPGLLCPPSLGNRVAVRSPPGVLPSGALVAKAEAEESVGVSSPVLSAPCARPRPTVCVRNT